MAVMTADLTEVTIETSAEELMTRVSAFNPYPEKAHTGMLVSCIQHPTSNPGMAIKYLATGEVYYVILPYSYEMDEFIEPEPTDDSAAPVYTDQDGKKFPQWMTFEIYLQSLSQDLVSKEFHSKARLMHPIWVAIVARFDDSDQPIFKPAKVAFTDTVKQAFRLLELKDFHSAWSLIDYVCHSAQLPVGETYYRDPAHGMFTYVNKDLAWEVCPNIVYHPQFNPSSGLWDVTSDTASEIQALLISTTRVLALQQAVSAYGNSQTALKHVLTTLEQEEARRQRVTEKLKAKEYEGKTYLETVLEYWQQHGISLDIPAE